MKLLKRYFIFSLSMLLVCGSVIPALAQGEKKEDLIGHWTFENGVELEDLTGHFSEIDLAVNTLDVNARGKLTTTWGSLKLAK